MKKVCIRFWFSFFAIVSVYASNISAQVKPDTDGAGSFGVLHNTTTLSKLKLVSIYKINGEPGAILRDDSGKNHSVAIGSYVGENDGKVVEIGESQIKVKQQFLDKNHSWQFKLVVLNLE